MERIIEVTGVGEARRVPDSVEMELTLTAENADYAAVTEQCGDAQSKLKAALVRAGLKAKALKTTDFSVDTVYDNARGENGAYVRAFRGFACRLALSVGFPFQPKRLGKVLTEIAACGAPCEYRLRFFASDAGIAAEEAARAAVADAERKAEILAQAAGIRLSALRELRYGGSGVSPYSETEFRPAARAVCLGAPEVSPADVKTTERVVMTFSIE